MAGEKTEGSVVLDRIVLKAGTGVKAILMYCLRNL
jgi:hypothetical protein